MLVTDDDKYIPGMAELAGVIHHGGSIGCEKTVSADSVVLAIGDKPDRALYESLKDSIPEIYSIADSNGGGIISNAVYDGYMVRK